jgi:hypothetical protein
MVSNAPDTLGLDSVRIEKAGENRLAMAPETAAASKATVV